MAEETRITSKTGGQKGQKEERFDLIPSPFLKVLAKVCGFGSRKYDDDNWRKGYSWRLSYGALNRHLHAFWTGEDIDGESGLHHLAHVAWHCFVLFTFSTIDRYKEFDDRPDMPSTPPINGDKKGALADHRDSINWLYDELEEESIAEAEELPDLDDKVHRATLQAKKDAEERQKLRNRIQWTEVIYGRTVDFIGTMQGFIDGEFLSGTAFTSQIHLLRNRCNNVDERVQKQERGEI